MYAGRGMHQACEMPPGTSYVSQHASRRRLSFSDATNSLVAPTTGTIMACCYGSSFTVIAQASLSSMSTALIACNVQTRLADVAIGVSDMHSQSRNAFARFTAVALLSSCPTRKHAQQSSMFHSKDAVVRTDLLHAAASNKCMPHHGSVAWQCVCCEHALASQCQGAQSCCHVKCRRSHRSAHPKFMTLRSGSTGMLTSL